MTARTDIAAAPNASVAQIVEYSTDPRGLGWFRALVQHTATLVGPTGGNRFFVKPAFWHGDTINPQRSTGAAHLGAARPVHLRESRLSLEKEANPTNAAAMEIFAERYRRGL